MYWAAALVEFDKINKIPVVMNLMKFFFTIHLPYVSYYVYCYVLNNKDLIEYRQICFFLLDFTETQRWGKIPAIVHIVKVEHF